MAAITNSGGGALTQQTASAFDYCIPPTRVPVQVPVVSLPISLPDNLGKQRKMVQVLGFLQPHG